MKHWQTLLIQSTPHSNWDDDDDDDDNDDDDNDSEGDSSDGDVDDEDSNNDNEEHTTRIVKWRERGANKTRGKKRKIDAQIKREKALRKWERKKRPLFGTGNIDS